MNPTVVAATEVLTDVCVELRAIGRDTAAQKIEGATRDLVAAADAGELTVEEQAELERQVTAKMAELRARHAAEVKAEIEAIRERARDGTKAQLAAALATANAQIAAMQAQQPVSEFDRPPEVLGLGAA